MRSAARGRWADAHPGDGHWRLISVEMHVISQGAALEDVTVWEKHVLRPTWDAMACATAATSGTPKTQLDVVFWATMESVVIVVYVSIAFMGIASLLHDAEQAHRWAPQDTLGARRAAQYSNAPNAKKPPVSPL